MELGRVVEPGPLRLVVGELGDVDRLDRVDREHADLGPQGAAGLDRRPGPTAKGEVCLTGNDPIEKAARDQHVPEIGTTLPTRITLSHTLSVTLTCPATVKKRTSATCTIVVRNNGPATATTVTTYYTPTDTGVGLIGARTFASNPDPNLLNNIDLVLQTVTR